MKIIQNDTNSATSNYVDYVDFGSKIERKILPVEEFLSLNPVPFQRFTEGRAKLGKVKKMLKD